MGISKADLVDADVYDATELNTDGSVVFLTITVVSTTSGTNTVVVNLAADGEGIYYGKDHPVEVGDTAIISGTSGGLGDGTFLVASVVDDLTFTTVEAIGTSTGGSVSFKFPPGANEIGFKPDNQNTTSNNNLQLVVTDISNATLLDDEPGSVGTTYTVTRSGSRVTQEKWVNTGNSFTIKQIDYTYVSDKVTTEVRKVFSAADGTTVIAQKTLTYVYSGNLVVGETVTRDV
jgi:hypothetical protein